MDIDNTTQERKVKRIYLPPKNGEGDSYPIDVDTSVVLIGSNGAGKTRMSVWIEQDFLDRDVNVIRITAQKSLKFKESISYTDAKKARDLVVYGKNRNPKKNIVNMVKWNNDPDVTPLDDVDSVLTFLGSEYIERKCEFQKIFDEQKAKNPNMALKDFPIQKSCSEIVAEIWNDVILHRTLDPSPSGFNVKVRGDDTQQYSMNRLSDGEKEIIYLMGEVLAAYPSSLIIIDEPENHLNRSILCNLWDKIEKARKDCIFLYVTHDYDFALSRKNSQIIWVQNVCEHMVDNIKVSSWDYKKIPDISVDVENQNNAQISIELNSLMCEICGSRQKVLLVEGDNKNSIDYRLYSKVYPDYNVIPVGSCENVMNAVSSYKNTYSMHHYDVVGIIDRDRRSPEQIESLKEKNIYVLKVSQIENLFMMPEIVSALCIKLRPKQSAETINAMVKTNTFKHIHGTNILNSLALLCAEEKYNQSIGKIYSYLSEKQGLNSNDFDKLVSEAFCEYSVSFSTLFENEKTRINMIIEDKNFEEAVALDKNKGLLQESELHSKFGFRSKDVYVDYIINYTGDDPEIGDQLRNAFKKYIGL